MQNFYDVDTTGKNYTLDVAPLIAADNKRAAVDIAGIQSRASSTGELIKTGQQLAQDYQARKDLANLQTGLSSLTPGSPDYERNVSQLVMQNPMAFNNKNTAPVAQAGMSFLAKAHAEALQRESRADQRGYMQERDRANFQQRKDYYDYTRKPGNGAAPLDLSGTGLEDTPAAPPLSNNNNNNNNNPDEDGDEGANDPTYESGTDPNDSYGEDGTYVGQNAAPAAPVDKGPLPYQQVTNNGTPQLPVGRPMVEPVNDLMPQGAGDAGDEGNAGPVGPKGSTAPVPMPPAAAVDKPGMVPSRYRVVTEQAQALSSDINKLKAVIPELERNGEKQRALQMRLKLADKTSELSKIANSPEGLAAQADASDAAQRERSARAAERSKPAVVNTLKASFPDLPEGFHTAAQAEIAGITDAASLDAASKRLTETMNSAEQDRLAGYKIPDSPEGYRRWKVAENAYLKAKDELNLVAARGLETDVETAKSALYTGDDLKPSEKEHNIRVNAAKARMERVNAELSAKRSAAAEAAARLRKVNAETGVEEPAPAVAPRTGSAIFGP